MHRDFKPLCLFAAQMTVHKKLGADLGTDLRLSLIRAVNDIRHNGPLAQLETISLCC